MISALKESQVEELEKVKKDGGIWRPGVAGGGCILWCVWGAVGEVDVTWGSMEA